MIDSPTSSFYYQSPPLQSPEPVAYNQHHSPIRHVEPPRRRAPSPQPTYNPPQTYNDIPSPSFMTPKQWTPVTPPVQTYNPPIDTYVPPPQLPPPPPHSAPTARSHLPFTPTVPAKKAASAPKPRQPTAKSAPATPAANESVPDYSYRSWGASIISPFAKKLEQEQAEQARDEPVHQQTSYVTPVSQKPKPGAKKHMVFEELSSALKKSSTFPKGTYAAKEFKTNDGRGTTVYKSGTATYSHVHFTHSYHDNGNNNSESDPGYVTPPMFFENYSERFEVAPDQRPKTVSTGMVLTLSDVPPAQVTAEHEDRGVVTVEQQTKEPSVIAITPLTINIKPLVSDVTAVTPQEKPAEAPASETTVIAAQPTTTEEPQTIAETVQQEVKQEITEESTPPAPPVDKESIAAPAEAATPAEETSSAEQVDKVAETKIETAAPPEGDTAAAPVETTTKTETPATTPPKVETAVTPVESTTKTETPSTPPPPEVETAVTPVESTTKTETPSTPEAATCAATQADTSVQPEEKGEGVSPVVNEVKEVEKEAATQPDSSSTEAAPVEKETPAASQEEVQTVQESETAKTTEASSSEVKTTDVKHTVTSETSTASEPTTTTKTETTVETTTKTTPTTESVVETTVSTTTVTEKTETVQHTVIESSTSEEHSAPAAEDKPEPKKPEGVEDKIEASSCPPAASSKTEEPAAETAASSAVPASVKEQSAGDQEQVTTILTPTPSEPTPTVVETTAQESQPVEKSVSDGQIAAPAPREGETTADTQTVKSEGSPSVNQSQSEDTSNKITTEIPVSETTTTTTTTTTTDTTKTTDNVTAAAAEDAKSSADKGLESNNRAQQKKVPAHERDWTQSELLRMIQANENANEPKSPAQAPVQSTPRPRASPPKKAAQPPPPPSPKPVSVSPVPPAYVDTGVSDF
eukprot:XP_014789483.1 PREDICTED: flocculation protein FLO11-like isoform X2 [Octopus bimaculoides]